MKISKVIIHNFRSILDSEFDLADYSLLVGENNAGKTTVISALRAFYEDAGVRFSEGSDFPKIPTKDKESWIELYFSTTPEEQESLKDEYKSDDNILRVRRYFKSENPDLVKGNQSNIYAYEKGTLSTNLFYGAKGVSQNKLGRIIYIPELSKSDENLKLSGPSPFREMVNYVFGKVIKSSKSFESLNGSFDKFNADFQKETSEDGYSMNVIEDEINSELKTWEIKFGIKINPIKPPDIVKSLLSHYIQDNNLTGNKEIDVTSLGQGLQRHLIYTLIKLSSNYADKKEEKKKEFSPDFTLILFEEPEAFLHPSQQEQMNLNLQKISTENNQQILITTHSPIFVCKNTMALNSIIKVQKKKGHTNIFQIRRNEIEKLFDANLSLFKLFSDLLADGTTPDPIKAKINNKNLGNAAPDLALKLEEETIKYFLWLDSERSSLFFAKHIIICEGASEKIFIDYLLNTKWQDLKEKHIYFLDAMGKFSIHRYMNLFGKLGISHSVLMDSDNDKDIHKYINDFIEANKNEFTWHIKSFDADLETFLGINKPNRADLKPLNLMMNHRQGNITEVKIAELKEMINQLMTVTEIEKIVAAKAEPTEAK
ncbi:ATP-dependent nuclease [Cecembia calidifontis]|jgi:predicted ATP-dependent endonuclease of OLD family|uniref:Putative ATP-dependent endonuclease of OLD family n=1 Tax=Cecembia calidifontis TaxID=1187080 RepID=A0A4Q7P639_9BACT|nr:AAA family ATPase [Cecembia calidifontis]RZS95425.1 putative ATP-dependent endonuclease of OLD family [Cecembia calidifontis]